MDEVDATVAEKPATHRKQMQRWMYFTIGAIALFLLLLTVWNIASRGGSEGQVDENNAQESGVKFTNPQETSNDPIDAFSGIRTDYARADGNQSLTDGQQNFGDGDSLAINRSERYSTDNFRTQPNRVGDHADGVIERLKENTGLAEKPEKSLMEQALEQWAVQEELRGLNSAKQPFSFGAGSEFSVAKLSPDTAGANEFNSKLDDLQAKRMDAKRNIEQAELLRDRLLNKSVNPEDVQRQLTALSTDFKSPPVDIAGYSKENSYQADVDGKIKLPPGTVIDAIFTQKTVSDYSNSIVKGMVTHDVYDVSKQFVLMPKGTEIILKSLSISNVNEPIQARMGFVVKWAVLPDGRKIDFSKAFFADREGVGAIKDKVNRHLLAQFLGVSAYALLSAESSRQGSGISSDNTYEGEVGQSLREQFSPLAAKYLNLVPTITIRSGQTFKLILEDEIFVDPWKDIYENYYS